MVTQQKTLEIIVNSMKEFTKDLPNLQQYLITGNSFFYVLPFTDGTQELIVDFNMPQNLLYKPQARHYAANSITEFYNLYVRYHTSRNTNAIMVN